MPEVSVIVRTRDRPLLLERALKSIAAQTFQDVEVIVYNDGGASVENIVARWSPRARLRGGPGRSVGMEAASNRAIVASSGRYIAIHDDDDSWHPTFISKCLEVLRASPPGVAAACCRLVWVDEQIDGQRIKQVRRYSYTPGLRGYVRLWDMAQGNMIAPIAVVYERRVHDVLGGYDESLPVLGDWEFYLRLLSRWDMVVVPEELAYYHHRCGRATTSDKDTVTWRKDLHEQYDALIRNRLLRQGDALGLAVNMARDVRAGAFVGNAARRMRVIRWVLRLLHF